jgi:nucleoside 2-deoxyribosyltransferase
MSTIFFSQAMDFLEENEIRQNLLQFKNSLNHANVQIVSGLDHYDYHKRNLGFEEKSRLIVEHDLELIQRSDILFADLSIPNRSYIGAIGEIIYAYQVKIPIIVFVGETNNNKRYWLYYHSSFISENYEDCIQRIMNYI